MLACTVEEVVNTISLLILKKTIIMLAHKHDLSKTISILFFNVLTSSCVFSAYISLDFYEVWYMVHGYKQQLLWMWYLTWFLIFSVVIQLPLENHFPFIFHKKKDKMPADFGVLVWKKKQKQGKNFHLHHILQTLSFIFSSIYLFSV